MNSNTHSNRSASGENGASASPAFFPIPPDRLTADGGAPEKRIMPSGAPAWIFSGTSGKQSVRGTLDAGTLPADCRNVKTDIVLLPANGAAETDAEEVYRVFLSQGTESEIKGTPVRSPVRAGSNRPGTVELDTCFSVDPALPLNVRIERLADDPADTFREPAALLEVRITPVKVPARDVVVQAGSGYNSWPMIQAMKGKLICAYTRGTAHDIGETCRGVYARTSSDGGKTWESEVEISNDPHYGEVTIGKGLDEEGAALFWVRCVGPVWHHDLYRTADGKTFTRIATPELDPVPMQITDIFHVPGTGLTALWFAGNYHDDALNAWGTLVSADNGKTWKQTVVERGIPKAEWPTEPSAVWRGDGRIFVIARTECVEPTTRAAQFQLESSDSGKTWTRARTNIGDVSISTPSLIADPATGLVSNYYYQRGRGVLKRRVVRLDEIPGHPLDWPDPEAVALGSTDYLEAGNVNATVLNGTHYLAYYSGRSPDTVIVVSAADAPSHPGERRNR